MSIQKRTYTTQAAGGRTATRTTWRVRWVDADGQHRSKQFTSHAEAVAFNAQAAARATDKGVIAGGSAAPISAAEPVELPRHRAVLVTLADLWSEWFPIYSATIAKATAEGYESCWTAHIEPALGTRPLEDFLTSFPVEQLHAQMAKRRVGASSIRKSLMLLKMMLDAGVSYRLLAFNGARTYHVGRRVSAKRQRPLVMIPAAQVEQMRAALLDRRQGAPGLTAREHNLRTVALLSLLAYAGLRPAEALALCWRDLDELHAEVHAGERVADGDAANPKTPTSLRRVPIIAPLMEDLLAWREVTPFALPSSPIIASQDGLPFNTQAMRNYARLIFAPAAKAVGIEKVRLYDLRHTWCMSQIRCGWDLLVLAERAGSSAETIATYYLAKPSLQRDLGIGDDVESFDSWVQTRRREAALKHRPTDEAASA